MRGRKHSVLTAYIEQRVFSYRKTTESPLKSNYLIYFSCQRPLITQSESKTSKDLTEQKYQKLKGFISRNPSFWSHQKGVACKKTNYARHWFFALCCKRLPFNMKPRLQRLILKSKEQIQVSVIFKEKGHHGHVSEKQGKRDIEASPRSFFVNSTCILKIRGTIPKSPERGFKLLKSFLSVGLR